MTPIRAFFNYKVEVPVEIGNPAHTEFLGGEYAVEDRRVSGFVTDVLVLNDVFTGKILKEATIDHNGYRVPEYADSTMNTSGVYVVFWEDRTDHYQMRIEPFNQITVTNGDMHSYVYRAQSK